MLLETRDALNLALEPKVKSKEIGHRREVEASLVLPRERIEAISSVASDLAEAFAVSAVRVTEGNVVSVEVTSSRAPRCPRCWRHRSDTGKNAADASLCARCADAVASRDGVGS